MREESLKNKAYKYIKSKIVNCEYEPGDFLDEKELIREINASRTPIREALNKIEQEKLIQIIPKKGIMVTSISLKNIVDVYEIRALIEPAAIELHWKKMSKEKLLHFKEIFENKQIPDKKITEDDDNFHIFILSAYDNDYMNKIMNEIRVQNQRIRIISGRLEECSHDSSKEHLKIIQSLLDEKPEEALKFMKEHILKSKKRTMKVIQKF